MKIVEVKEQSQPTLSGRFFTEKSSSQAVARQLLLVMFLLLVAPIFVNADIVYKGNCGQYSYNLNIKTNKYHGGHCKNDVLVAYYDARRSYIRGIYSDPQVSTTIDTFRLSDGRVYNTFDWTQNNGTIVHVGMYAGLIMVLAGSFIGFTILFFSTYLFIEVAKK